MKPLVCVILLGLAHLGMLSGQDIVPLFSDSKVVSRGAHHRTWEVITTELGRDGRRVERKGTYVELATGLHHRDEKGEWVVSNDKLELFRDGAVGRNAGHKVIFEPNFTGLIDLQDQDGKRFRSRIIGLALYDNLTGNSTLIAEPKDSIGVMHPPNQIVYPSAFDGVQGDVHYTYTVGGFQQDVVILEQIQLPQGFNPASTQLEIWTEFAEAPTVVKTPRARAEMADDALDFGSLHLGDGHVMTLDNVAANRASVRKQWLLLENRRFLVEAVSYHDIKAQLDRLPAAQARAPGRKTRDVQVVVGRIPPPAPVLKAKKNGEKIQAVQSASLTSPGKGLVIDYDMSASVTNFVFQSDTTYYISGPVTLYQTNLMEGSCVLKYAPTNSAKITVNGVLQCLGSPYRPSVLTARDDHSVGTQIGSASLSGYYARYGLWFAYQNLTQRVDNIRVSHAVVGLAFDELDHHVLNSQFVHCGDALEPHFCNSRLENVLFYNVTNVLHGEWGRGSSTKAAHLTVNAAGHFAPNSLANEYWAYVTNSLIVNLGSWDCELATNAVVETSNSAIFQTVGDARHYLSDNTYRDVGVNGISTTLREALKEKTTFPPVVLSAGSLSNGLTLSVQAQRDRDTLDLGFHYDPIDYAVGHITLYEGAISVQQGTCLGTYGTTANDYGLALFNNAALVCEGTPTNLVSIVRHNTVQEQSTNNWAARMSESLATPWIPQSAAPSLRCRFTRWSTLAQDTRPLSGYGGNDLVAEFRDCQLFGGQLYTDLPTLSVSNCLMERVLVTFNDNLSNTLRHCTFYGGALDYSQDNNGTFTVYDTFFDRTVITSGGTFVHDYNGYVTNQSRIPSPATHDVVLTNAPTYHVGPLGGYYFPTNDGMLSLLINAGSTTNAGLASLYHHTTTTNQVKDGSTRLDIGFHFIAVTNGVAIDSDFDGVPDYQEDVQGDGALNSGETSLTDASDWGLKVLITRPMNRSNLP